jgi:hypothetical protein
VNHYPLHGLSAVYLSFSAFSQLRHGLASASSLTYNQRAFIPLLKPPKIFYGRAGASADGARRNDGEKRG